MLNLNLITAEEYLKLKKETYKKIMSPDFFKDIHEDQAHLVITGERDEYFSIMREPFSDYKFTDPCNFYKIYLDGSYKKI